MANKVSVRTAAGDVLSLPITPADVIGRCAPCRKVFREGDWYCAHLAARYGHAIAWLDDQGAVAPSATPERAGVGAPADLVRPAGFAVTFESPAL